VIRRARRRVGAALDRRFRAVNERVEFVGAGVDALAATVGRLEALTTTLASELAKMRQTNAEALRWLVQEGAANRVRLRELRTQPSYAAVFDDPAPLVSVVIPTYDNTELLLSRSLPSVLAQTYEKLEIIVVGDAVEPEVGAAVEALGDARVRFVNVTQRIPDPDPMRQWLIGSVAPRIAGHELARGAWLMDFDDDDHLRPHAVEHDLGLARHRRLEVAYGPLAMHWPDGTVETVAEFPPAFARFATQGALVHGGLRFFERSLAAAVFDVPNDWFRIEAMLRAGVRFGMHDEIVVDYFPSLRAFPELRTSRWR
jgi:hypothetical protein